MKVLFRAEVDIEISPVHEGVLTKIEDKWYAVGNWNEIIRNDKITPQINVYDKRTNTFLDFFVKEETKAIHVEDMIDSESNPIFASFDIKNKIGGDIITHPMDLEEDKIYPIFFAEGATRRYFPFGKSYPVMRKYRDYQVIGIKQ